jgi:hypothetical protein
LLLVNVTVTGWMAILLVLFRGAAPAPPRRERHHPIKSAKACGQTLGRIAHRLSGREEFKPRQLPEALDSGEDEGCCVYSPPSLQITATHATAGRA